MKVKAWSIHDPAYNLYCPLVLNYQKASHEGWGEGGGGGGGGDLGKVYIERCEMVSFNFCLRSLVEGVRCVYDESKLARLGGIACDVTAATLQFDGS